MLSIRETSAADRESVREPKRKGPKMSDLNINSADSSDVAITEETRIAVFARFVAEDVATSEPYCDKPRAAVRAALDRFEEALTEAEVSSHDECLIEFESEEWLVLTDEEADERAAEYIADSLWAFRPEFLAAYTSDGIDEDEIRAIVGDRCESANSSILALVKAGRGLDSLTENAIGADGRGHFLSHYDGEEHETEDSDGTTWYLYRTN